MTIRLYIPTPTSELNRIVLPKSAIVGQASDVHQDQIVYYEGNAHQALNLTRYVERVACATGRLIQKYPTSAIMYVSSQDVQAVGYYDSITKVVVDPTDALSEWLSFPTIPTRELVYKNPTVVRDIEHFKQLASLGEGANNFVLLLNYGARSSCSCRWDGQRFWVTNFVDGSEQVLTSSELYIESHIGEGIRRRAFFFELPGVEWGIR